jgi:nicotinamidase-related amidase
MDQKLVHVTRESFDCRATGLMIMDVQYYCAVPHVGRYSDSDGSVNPYYFARIKNVMLPNIQTLLAHARTVGMETIYAIIESATKNGRDRSRAHKLAGIHVAKNSFDAKVLESICPTEFDILIPRSAIRFEEV